jgi:hypothetical protein
MQTATRHESPGSKSAAFFLLLVLATFAPSAFAQIPVGPVVGIVVAAGAAIALLAIAVLVVMCSLKTWRWLRKSV